MTIVKTRNETVAKKAASEVIFKGNKREAVLSKDIKTALVNLEDESITGNTTGLLLCGDAHSMFIDLLGEHLEDALTKLYKRYVSAP